MRIVDIREKTVSLAADIGNAIMSMSELTTSVVAVETDVVRNGRPVVGYGFSAYGRYGQGGLMRERFFPRLMQADPRELLDETGGNLDPLRISAAMRRNEKPGGHGERSVAVGTIDMAVWDAVAKIAEKPLAHLLAERFGAGRPAERVALYVGGGYYYPARDIEQLQDELRHFRDQGFVDLKIKVGGAPIPQDLKRIEAAIAIVGTGAHLSIDASAAFDRDAAVAFGKAVEPYGLRWYEDVCDPLDFEAQRAVAESYAPPLATGESLFSMPDHRNLIRYGGLRPGRDRLLFDVPHCYGLPEILKTLAMLEEHGWPRIAVWPHGGHLFSLQVAAGLGLGGTEAHPAVFQPFAGFADATPVENGMIALPDVPGIGWEARGALHALFRETVG